MSPAAASFVTLSAIYAFAAAYHAALWARARLHDPEQLTWGAVCLAFSVHSAGAALLQDARTLAEGAVALRIQLAAAFCGSALYVDFVSHLVDRPGRRVVLAVYALAIAGVVANLAGLLVDAERHAFELTPLRGSRWVEPALRPHGIAAGACMLACALVAIGALVRHARRDPDARAVAMATALGVLAAAHDAFVRVLGLGWSYRADHAGLLAVPIVGWALVRRFLFAATELERRTDELARSYDDLRRTQEALVRKEQLAAVGELSAVIAHEVRNPLAILKNAVSTLRHPTLTGADRDVLLDILDEETDRLNRLVRDLLAYARPVAPRGAPVPVAQLVETCCELARRGRRTGADVTLEVDLEQGPRTVLGDPESLRHALVNVVENALQAMPGGGRLSIRARPARIGDRPACALAFADTGEGMDTLVRAKAMDPFFTTRPAGIGLGLAIVDRIVKNHGGTLVIDSAPGTGTTVTLTLPTSEGDA